ncbi:helix-turn-helix domain-containing protein [Tenacibaculum sp. nBUS_03]|uniref:helix-turn-helix domain-containing protein n=1 Tax=Tenacibaculum sp. nBUS_03 TaxID=3395320 RepID=UPI003EBBCBFA
MQEILQIHNITKKEFVSILNEVVEQRVAKILEKPKSKYLTVKEACEEARVCDKTMRNWLKEFDFKAKKMKGKIMITREVFEKKMQQIKSKEYQR